MKVYFLPKTALGKWSIGLIVGSIAFVLAFLILRKPEFGMNLPIMIVCGISGIAAFLTGIIGIIKSKDRSVIVFITTIVGFFIFLLMVAVRLPH